MYALSVVNGPEALLGGCLSLAWTDGQLGRLQAGTS